MVVTSAKTKPLLRGFIYHLKERKREREGEWREKYLTGSVRE